MKRGLIYYTAAAIYAVLLVPFVTTNYRHGNAERRARALWTRQNGKMLEFVQARAAKCSHVYQFCDDPESSESLGRYVMKVRRRDVGDWISLPVLISRTPKWHVVVRPVSEIHGLFDQAVAGDLVLVPVVRANVSYVRMPLYSRASQGFPQMVPQSVQTRLQCIYSEYEESKHKSIPPQVESYLKLNGRTDLLTSLKASGMQMGFGWQVYRVR